jgi:nucleotide-binding universal stress UspA family protein
MRGDKPFPRIVVPIDGSQLSQSAAHAAGALARRAGVPLTLFGVTYSEGDRDDLGNTLNEVITTLRRDLVVDLIVDVIGAEVTVDGYVAEAILDEADVDGALVCIASHGHRGLGVALLGSVTEEVIGKSPRPVLVVGPRFEPRPWRHDGMIVASVDGSLCSEQAVPLAAEWSATFGVPLWLVEVAAPYRGPTAEVATSGDVSEFGYLKRLAERFANVNFDVLHSRHPAHELADLADRWPVNVMVMATHGRSGWSRLTLGSVAMNVVHRATCPVLLVRPGRDGPDGNVERGRPAQ